MKTLSGPFLKVGRAETHINDIALKIDAFVRSDPYQIVQEPDPAAGNEVVRARLTKPIPELIDIIIGEVIYNLHSALDLMTCELAVLNGRGVSGVYFPFGKSTDDFISQGVQEKIKNLSNTAQAMLNSFRPYSGGNNDLWLIHPLSIIGKHRRLVAVGHSGMLRRMVGVKITDCLIIGNAPTWKSFEEGVELYRVGSGAQVQGGAQTIAVNIAFGEPQEAVGKPIVDALKRMSDATRKVLIDVENQFFT
jgi:hypothetical protein